MGNSQYVLARMKGDSSGTCSLSSEHYTLNEGGVFLIGRGEENRIVVLDRYISRVHAKIVNNWGEVMLEDLESRNGTFVNEVRIKPGIEEPLNDYIGSGDGCVLRFGLTNFFVYRNGGEDEELGGNDSKEPLKKAICDFNYYERIRTRKNPNETMGERSLKKQ